MADHEDLRELIGPYVLGGVPAHDRERLERHAATCAACREELAAYAGLPALLRYGAAAGPAVTASPQLVARTIAAARSSRGAERSSRRWRATVAAAAIAVAAAWFGIAEISSDSTRRTPGIQLAATSTTSAAGTVRLASRPWGTAVDLELAGLPKGRRFVAWVIGDNGRREQAATWSSTANGVSRLSGACSIPLGEIAAVRIATDAGELLLQTRA